MATVVISLGVFGEMSQSEHRQGMYTHVALLPLFKTGKSKERERKNHLDTGGCPVRVLRKIDKGKSTWTQVDVALWTMVGLENGKNACVMAWSCLSHMFGSAARVPTCSGQDFSA